MKSMFMISVVTVGVLLFGGCALKDMKDRAVKSGFLGNYAELSEDDEYKGVGYWVNQNTDFSKYDSAIVVPVLVNHGVAEKNLTPQRKELYKKSSDYLTASIENKIMTNGRFKLVTEPSPTTLKLEIQISAVQVEYEDMKFYHFVPAVLVGTIAARGSGISKASVRVLAEGRVTDSLTNEAVIRTMSLQKGQEISSSGEELVFGDVKPALDHFIANASKRLVEMKKSYKKSKEAE